MNIGVLSLSAVVAFHALFHPAQAATVWSGYAITFSKPDGVDPLSPQGQDPITANVALTRVNNGGGFINPRAEIDYDKPASPAGTSWAFPYNNPGQLIAAANWANLSFLPWAAAFGGNSSGGPPGTIGQSAVVHLLADDVYLDLRLTGWTVRAGGGFSYQRAAPPSPGDFNVDGFVDGADFLRWQLAAGRQAPTAALTSPTGAPNFGSQASAVAGASVPEPTTFWLVLAIASGGFAARRRFVSH